MSTAELRLSTADMMAAIQATLNRPIIATSLK